MVKKFPRYFWHDPRTWQTDGQTGRRTNANTDTAWQHTASRGKKAAQHVPVYLQQFPSYSNHNCKKSPFLRTPAFIFCLLWVRPCGNHAKRCMNEKTIQCLQNIIRTASAKKSLFSRTASHILCFPGVAPATITQHIEWMERQFNAC